MRPAPFFYGTRGIAEAQPGRDSCRAVVNFTADSLPQGSHSFRQVHLLRRTEANTAADTHRRERAACDAHLRFDRAARLSERKTMHAVSAPQRIAARDRR